MVSILIPVIVGLVVGISLIVMFAVLTPSETKLSVSEFSRIRDHPFLTDDVAKKSVEAASQHELTQEFLDKFGSDSRLKYSIAYLDGNQVNRTKYSSEGKQGEAFAFLPDSKPAILVMMRVDVTPIEEHPILAVYIDPDTYRTYGAFRAFW
jgi:hypothetical protein